MEDFAEMEMHQMQYHHIFFKNNKINWVPLDKSASFIKYYVQVPIFQNFSIMIIGSQVKLIFIALFRNNNYFSGDKSIYKYLKLIIILAFFEMKSIMPG